MPRRKPRDDEPVPHDPPEIGAGLPLTDEDRALLRDAGLAHLIDEDEDPA